MCLFFLCRTWSRTSLGSVVCRDCLATALPAREPLAPGWWAWLREFLSFDIIWELFAVVAPRVLPLSWAKVISELRWSSYLTNTEGISAARPCSLKRSCQNPRLLSYKIKHSFLFWVRMKSKQTLHGFTIWWESGDSDPCLQLCPYQDSEERHHRGEAARLCPPWRKCTHARHLPFFHSQKISARQSWKRKASCRWKNQERKGEVNAPLANVSIPVHQSSPGEAKTSGTTQHWWDL